MSNNNNNNKNKFVVKLGLSSDGEAGPFRRLGFPRFIGSHKRLCEAAAELAMADSGARVVQYKLRLTFKDEDGDSCLLLNDSDIKMAVTESDKPMKVFADVLELSAVSANPPCCTSVPPEAPAQTRTVESESSTPRASSTGSTSSNNSHPPVLHQAVESIVGVLANAVVGLQQASMPDDTANSTNTARSGGAPTTVSLKSNETPEAEKEEETEETLVQEEEEERAFIHGRHTCDACLTTPIVGKRFHAVNMQDYDLCQGCYLNYSGTEITFEEAELDRDRPMQERWHRRYAKWGTAGRPHFRKHGGRGGRFGGPRGRGRFGPPHHPPHGPPHHPPHGHFPPPPHGHGPPFPPPHGMPPPFAPPREVQPEDVDAALKEAIRRSMEDVKEAETQTESKQTNTEAVQTEEPSEEHEPEITVEAEPEIVVEAKQAVVPASDKSQEGDQSQASAKSTPSKATTSTQADNSFALDAAGNGDVAGILGETMDKIAFAIQEMNVELERESSNTLDNDEDSDKESEIVVETVNEEDDEEDDKAGAVIIGGDEPNDDEISQNSWDVVEDQVAHDESLARAAQVIGSALFNSGMSESRANSQGNGSNVSVDSSVPTDLPSITSDNNAGGYIPDALLQRWAPQLSQLHEIGFQNDALSIEIMERLEAANIGSGEDSPITVTRVVNEMMRDRW